MQPDSSVSQTDKAVYGLRGLIVEGKLKPGDRVLEQTLVDQFGVSRTPARSAILRVSEEGLITAMPFGGFVVASFTDEDVYDSIAIRGTLEGMAARLAAEKGLSSTASQAFHDCLKALDLTLQSDELGLVQSRYVQLNDQFHGLVIGAARSPMVSRAFERLVAIPFSVNNSFIDVPPQASAGVLQILKDANAQHHCIVEAIENREGTRAQALMIEHSRSAWRYLKLMLNHQKLENPDFDIRTSLLSQIT